MCCYRCLSLQVMVKQPPPCPGFPVLLAAWWQGWANASSECLTSEVREAASSVILYCEADTPTHVLLWSHIILKVIHTENGWVLLARPILFVGLWLRAPDKINLITLATYLCLFLCYHRGPCNSADPPT